MHYALRGVDDYFSDDTRDAVYAFQKLYGLVAHRLGRRGVLATLLPARDTPTRALLGRPRRGDKSLQVLFVVRGGKVVLDQPRLDGRHRQHAARHAGTSTARPRARCPTGMFDSSFFLRGFAIHGYPSVPPCPASHGCVRVPMWLAPRLYDLIPYGSEIDIYL